MDLKRAKSLGRKRAYESVVIGLIIFYLVGVFIFSNEGLRSLLWLSYLDLYNWIFVVNWIATFVILGYFIGTYAGKEILHNQKSYWVVGIKSGVVILAFGAFLGCFLGFMLNGIENLETNKNPLMDYFLKPVFWIFLYGLIPSIFIGLFFGWRIKNSL